MNESHDYDPRERLQSQSSQFNHQQKSFQNQQKCLSNYLNQSFKESEVAAQSDDEHEQQYIQEQLNSSQIGNKNHRRSISHVNSLEHQRQQQIQQQINASMGQGQTPGGHQRSNSASRLNQNASALSVAMGYNDPRKNDTKYACLQVRRAEFFCTKENLIKHSHYLMRVFEKQEFAHDAKERNAQIKIKLPESTKADILIMFLDYIDKGKELPNKIDLYIAQNVLLIAEALKMRQIQKKFLLEILMPMLNRENVIYFTKMAYNKLSAGKNDDNQLLQDDLESQTSHQDEEEFWFDFFSYALDMAAQYVQYLIKKKNNELHTVLEPSIVEEIIERAIRFYRADLQYDNTLLFDTLLKVRKCDSIFQLLEQERVKIIENEQSILSQTENVRPTLTWRIQNLQGNFYRESDPFLVENAQWRLSISYFKMEEESLNVQIKMANNPFEVKKSKDYFKKKDFFLASNVAGGIQNQINPLDDALDDDNMTSEEIQRRRKQIEQANAEYPSHSFITIVSAVRINSDERLSEPLVHTLICSAKTPAHLKKFLNFNIEDYDGAITVEIYFKVKYIYSAILLYISRNFTYLITDPMISLLPKEQMKLILKHKLLNATQEDEVVKALCMWGEGQEHRDHLDNDLIELLENVNWNYVSLQCLLDLIRNFPYVRRNPTFHKVINKEFAMRNRFNPETTNLDPPRFSYKYNKVQNNSNLNKNAKNAKALLYVNHENFFQNLIDALLEPVDIIKSHLVNEGINESSHRKHLELQLLQKKREITLLEDQLNNMKIMDELALRAGSRCNSRLNKGNTSIHTGKNTSGYYNTRPVGGGPSSECGDELETVKNSMINLLNVVMEAEDNASSTQQNRQLQQDTAFMQQRMSQNGKQATLVELSQEVLQKMQQQNNQKPDNEVNFEEMYEELNTMAQNRKLKIMFNSRSESGEAQEAYQNMHQSSISQGVEPHHQNQHEEEEEEDSYEEESKYPSTKNLQSNQQAVPVTQRTESLVIVNTECRAGERGSKTEADLRLMKRIQSFTSQSSKIIVGGGSLVSPGRPPQIQNLQNQLLKMKTGGSSSQQQQQKIAQQRAVEAIREQLNESKGIQTSLKFPSKEEILLNLDNAAISPINVQRGVDQSIQLTFEEPPYDKDNFCSIPLQDFDGEAAPPNMDEHHFLSNPSKTSISAVSIVQQTEGGDVTGHHNEEANIFEDRSLSIHQEGEDLNTKECIQPQVPFLSPEHAHSNSNEPHPNKQAEELLSAARQRQEFEQIKLTYQKQLMQEYTSLVEKMSKDVFDTNFLQNFQLFQSPAQGAQFAQTLDGHRASLIGMSGEQNGNFQSPYNNTLPNAVQVQNPKVHNLNISIHNNANYGSPYPLDQLGTTQQYTPIQRFPSPPPPQQHQNLIASPLLPAQPQFNATQQSQFMTMPNSNAQSLNQTLQIPAAGSISASQNKATPSGANNVTYKPSSAQPSSMSSPSKHFYTQHQQQQLGHNNPEREINYNRQRPLSSTVQQQSHRAGVKMSGKNHCNHHSSGTNLKKQYNLHLDNNHCLAAESSMRSHTPMINHSHQEISAKNNQHMTAGLKNYQGVFAGNAQLKLKGGLNSPQLAQYVNTAPGSVKNTFNERATKTYGYQTQQQAHQKVVKASAINKNQNKVILQQILNNDNSQHVKGTIVGQRSGGGTGNTYQMTIDPSGTMMNTHHKTKSQPNNGIFQWSTAHYSGGQNDQLHYTQGVLGNQQKTNDHIQNEIMRLIVEDSSSFQQVPSQQPVHGQQQSWSNQVTPQSAALLQQNQVGIHSKRGSIQSQANAFVAANYNILDQLKQTQKYYTPMQSNLASTVSLKQPLAQQYQAQKSEHEVKQQSHFGSLVLHHQKQNQQNVILDLNNLKNAAQNRELCTIEESKRTSDNMTDNSHYAANQTLQPTFQNNNGGSQNSSLSFTKRQSGSSARMGSANGGQWNQQQTQRISQRSQLHSAHVVLSQTAILNKKSINQIQQNQN